MNLDFHRREFDSWNKQFSSFECVTARFNTSTNFNESQQQMCSINSAGKSRIVVAAVFEELVFMVSAGFGGRVGRDDDEIVVGVTLSFQIVGRYRTGF